MKKIYLTRHGQTDANVMYWICGRHEATLTDLGREQARRLGREIEVEIDEIICSPLQRARETAQLINESLSVPIRVDERLIEVDFGTYDGQDMRDEHFLHLRSQFPYQMPGGESLLQVAQRAYNLLDELKADDKVYLLVCHNAVSRVINSYFHQADNKTFFEFNMENCQLLALTYEK